LKLHSSWKVSMLQELDQFPFLVFTIWKRCFHENYNWLEEMYCSIFELEIPLSQKMM
jgi:hypothetical protein